MPYQMREALDNGGHCQVVVRGQQVVDELRPQDGVHGRHVDGQQPQDVVTHLTLGQENKTTGIPRT